MSEQSEILLLSNENLSKKTPKFGIENKYYFLNEINYKFYRTK